MSAFKQTHSEDEERSKETIQEVPYKLPEGIPESPDEEENQEDQCTIGGADDDSGTRFSLPTTSRVNETATAIRPSKSSDSPAALKKASSLRKSSSPRAGFHKFRRKMFPVSSIQQREWLAVTKDAIAEWQRSQEELLGPPQPVDDEPTSFMEPRILVDSPMNTQDAMAMDSLSDEEFHKKMSKDFDKLTLEEAFEQIKIQICEMENEIGADKLKQQMTVLVGHPEEGDCTSTASSSYGEDDYDHATTTVGDTTEEDDDDYLTQGTGKDDDSVSSLDLLFRWMTCSEMPQEPERLYQGPDPHLNIVVKQKDGTAKPLKLAVPPSVARARKQRENRERLLRKEKVVQGFYDI